MLDRLFSNKHSTFERSADLFDRADGDLPSLSGGLVANLILPSRGSDLYGQEVNDLLQAAALDTAKAAAVLPVLRVAADGATARLAGADSAGPVGTIIIELLPTMTAMDVVLVEVADRAAEAEAAADRYRWDDSAFLRDLDLPAIARPRREATAALLALPPADRANAIRRKLATDPGFAVILYTLPIDPAVALDLDAATADLIAEAVQERFGYQNLARRRALSAAAERLRGAHKAASDARDSILRRFNRPSQTDRVWSHSVQAQAWEKVDQHQTRNAGAPDRLTAGQTAELQSILGDIERRAADLLSSRSTASA